MCDDGDHCGDDDDDDDCDDIGVYVDWDDDDNIVYDADNEVDLKNICK